MGALAIHAGAPWEMSAKHRGRKLRRCACPRGVSEATHSQDANLARGPRRACTAILAARRCTRSDSAAQRPVPCAPPTQTAAAAAAVAAARGWMRTPCVGGLVWTASADRRERAKEIPRLQGLHGQTRRTSGARPACRRAPAAATPDGVTKTTRFGRPASAQHATLSAPHSHSLT